MGVSVNGGASPNGEMSPRAMLQRVVDTLTRAGFYAYLHIDEQNQWSVSADTESGHVDVRLGGGGYVLEAWDTSPGLFWDEQDQRRFHARERRARMVLPAISRGLEDPDQEIWWDEVDHGVGARVREYVPFKELAQLPARATIQFDALNHLLTEVERRLTE